jgi:protein tyrosine/serine phosphatase
MNHFNASRQPMPAQRANTAVPGSAEARKVAERLMDAMSALLGLVERETELVRAGKVREAMTLESKKQELSKSYVGAVSELKANQEQLAKSAPELLSTLHRHHDAFRAMLQVNLTVLATAHAVSESVVRGVNAEIQKRNVPNTYTAAGRRATPGPRHITPLAVSRSL